MKNQIWAEKTERGQYNHDTSVDHELDRLHLPLYAEKDTKLIHSPGVMDRGKGVVK